MAIAAAIVFGLSTHLISSNSNAFIQSCRPWKRCEDNGTLLNVRSTWPAQQSQRLRAFDFEKSMHVTVEITINHLPILECPQDACLASVGLSPFGRRCKALQRQQQLAAAEREALRTFWTSLSGIKMTMRSSYLVVSQ